MASSPTTSNKEMQINAARFNTFQTAHQLSKRRASSQTTSNSSKKRGAAANNVMEWPHERPAPEELSRAGFFYKPAQDSNDNVQCFHCAVKLDGWEAEDDPLAEHLAHSANCNWALSLSAGDYARTHGLEDAAAATDPMSELLVTARKGTFESGSGWPHEGKRGWKCKVAKMVEAGWSFDPGPAATEDDEEEIDGVTCFYCILSLDGWEPKDDPMEEHKRRSPECPFFALVERYGSTVEKKPVKGRGKKGAGRASTASKASSRLSTQSTMSVLSQEPSFADVGLGLDGDIVDEAAFDDSIMSTASTATATGTTKGKKNGGRPKAAAKGAKGRKRAGTVDSQAEPNVVVYPDLEAESQDLVSQQQDLAPSSQATAPEVPALPLAKKGRKGTRQSKQPQVDSSIMEVSSMDVAGPAKKATRGRKAKAQPEPPSTPAVRSDDSDVSAQLQEELERSMSFDIPGDFDQSTPQPERPTRGVKRTSEGVQKKQWKEDDVSHVLVEFPVPPKPAAPAAKGKRGRQASKQIAASQESHVEEASQQPVSTQEDAVMSEVEVEAPKPVKVKKAPAAKAKGKGRKASSIRSSRSSKATVIAAEPEQPTRPEAEEDLERDEREIEAELERIAAEQAAIQAETEKSTEFEPSPSRNHSRRPSPASQLSSRRSINRHPASPPPQLPPLNLSSKNATPSPTGSDKENNPTSILSTKPAATFISSPTKTTRIPLAPGTPNRNLSPRKLHLSPSKSSALLPLTSTHPWLPIDLDAALLASPQPTPGTLASRLVSVAGALSEEEAGLTVEEWVRLQAGKAEEELRRRCEGMVSRFEGEGGRAMMGVGGIVVG